MWKFADYLSRKNRNAIERLNIMKSIFEENGFKLEDKISNKSEPYLFIYNPFKNLSFEGVRLYSIGEKIAFRIQKNSSTEPYGRAYSLDVESLFEDLISINKKDSKIAEIIGKTIAKELKDFFKQSEEAEKEQDLKLNNPLDRVMVRSTGSDYSSGMTNASQKTGNGIY